MDKAAEALYREKEKRLTDTIELRVPDRVTVSAGMGYFPAKYTGITCKAAWYDFDAWVEAYRKTLPDFQPDYMNLQPFSSGKAMEYLKPKGTRWPGYGVPDNHSHQSIEREVMTANEYDDFMNDPTDFWLRTYIPRTNEALEALSQLPRLSAMGYGHFGVQMLAVALAKPEVAEAISTLQEAGREMLKWQPKARAFMKEIEDMGYPSISIGAALTPFDSISHSMRGMHGSFTDMFRHPDKIHELSEKMLALVMASPLPPPNMCGNTRVFIPLTRGSDDFMSMKQFEEFYWPVTKRLIEYLIENGVNPVIFYEGNFTSRLEHMLELPKGKIIAQLDRTDIFRAKEVLKGHTCIKGNVPSSLLQVGTVQEVKDYCKKLIDVVGKDGGFILSPRSSTDEAKPENLKAMIDFTKEYGVYR